MNKEFVPYTESLALKELGFDEPCFRAYKRKSKALSDNLYSCMRNSERRVSEEHPEGDESICVAPLYQQAFRWFREKHNLVFNFMSYAIISPKEYHWSITWNDTAKATGRTKTYEEAELECLRELIKIVKDDKTRKT